MIMHFCPFNLKHVKTKLDVRGQLGPVWAYF